MTNITREVWRIIDNDTAVQKSLLQGLINTSALARKIAKEHYWVANIDAVLSAIRRYEAKAEKRESIAKIYKLFKEAKLSTKTKLASALFRKKAGIRDKLAKLYAQIDFEGGDVLRIFEVTKYIKIIIDEKNLEIVDKIFIKNEIEAVTKKLGELAITYPLDVTKTPGVFAMLSNELALNNISIIDSMICHSEHIIIVHEEEIRKTFDVVFNLTKS